MKASELIEKLEQLKKVYGDCEVTCDRYNKNDITEVEIDTTQADGKPREIVIY